MKSLEVSHAWSRSRIFKQGSRRLGESWILPFATPLIVVDNITKIEMKISKHRNCFAAIVVNDKSAYGNFIPFRGLKLIIFM